MSLNRRAGEPSVARFVEPQDHRLGHRQRRANRDAFDGRHLQFAGSGPHRRTGDEQGGAGKLSAARDDQDSPLGLLVAVDHRRQREGLERGTGQRFRPDRRHRVPVILSGSVVWGAPSASSGAPWFHTSSFGTHRPSASASKS